MAMISFASRYLSQKIGDSPNLGAGTSGLTVCTPMQLFGWARDRRRQILKPLVNVSLDASNDFYVFLFVVCHLTIQSRDKYTENTQAPASKYGILLQ
jgi:hypothetical protein